MTWPLGRYLRRGIPYTDRPHAGSEVLSLVEGDHLQLYYHYWLFHDALYGDTGWFRDPYEFHGDPGFRRFTTQRVPDAAVAAVLSFGDMPLGYNLWALLTTAAAGLAAYALGRRYGLHPLASTFAGVYYAFLPYRIGHLCGGHQTGFALWLYPASWLALETALRSPRPWLGAGLAGLMILSASLTDVQVAYYMILGLGVFGFARALQTLVRREDCAPRDVGPLLRLGVAAGSVVLVVLGIVQTMRRFDPPAVYVGSLWFVGWGVVAWVAWSRAVAGPARWGRILAAAALVSVGAYAASRSWAVVAIVVSLAPPALAPWAPPREAIPRFRRLAVLAGPLLIGVGLAAAWMLYDVGGAVVETAWRNLRGGEAHLYSPWLSDAWAMSPDVERRMALGYAAFAAGCLGFLRVFVRRRIGTAGETNRGADFPWTLWVVFFLLAFALAFGPRLRHLAPLYDWARFVLPFYEKSRTTSRIFTLAALAWAMIAAFGLDGILRAGRNGGVGAAARLIAAAAIVVVLIEFRPPRGVGISLLPRSPSVYEGQTDGTTLALPIWPGDSSASSVYLYYATESRSRLVNGYSPIVSAGYVERVFEPLYDADFGEWTPAMGHLLRELGVSRVILHEDRLPERLSPFGPAVAVRRTFETPVLRHEVSDGPLHRFGLADPIPASASWAPARSALGRFLRATDHAGNGGWSAPAPDALGDAVVRPRSTRPDGYLVKTRSVALPGGSYRCSFRLRLVGEDGSGRPLVLLRARLGEGILAERSVRAAELEAGRFVPVDLSFQLDGTAGVSWTIWREPGGDVECDGLLVTTDPALPQDCVEAEASRYLGWTRASAQASDGAVVVSGGEGFPAGEIMAAGPRRIFGPGRYRAEVVLGPDGPVGHGDPTRVLVRVVDVADGTVFGQREAVVGGDEEGVRSVGFDVELFRDAVLDLEVRYFDGGSCCVDVLRLERVGGGAGP